FSTTSMSTPFCGCHTRHKWMCISSTATIRRPDSVSRRYRRSRRLYAMQFLPRLDTGCGHCRLPKRAFRCDSMTDVRFVRTNGIDLEVFTAGAPESDKLALCLHGFPEHAHSWRFQMPVLAELGYRVWAPNMRGYGHSARPRRMRDYAIEELLADVA